MNRPLLLAALAVLTSCGPEPALEAGQPLLAESSDPGSAQDVPSTQDINDDLNGTSVILAVPTTSGGCELTTSMNGGPLPYGCSNNGPLLASTLAWVSLDSITAPDGSAVDSASLQGTRFTGIVNGTRVSDEAFVGAQFNGTATDGSLVRLRLDSAEPGSDKQVDVWRYDFSYQNAKGEWKQLCTKGHKRAVVVSGRWDYHQGNPGDGRKLNDPTVFTIGCRRSAIEKCINAGYKPWATAGGVSLDAYHQACVRLMRADYCGDGVSHTIAGRQVDLYDRIGIQTDTKPWLREAEWTAGGARCVSSLNLTTADASCVPILGTTSCGEMSSFSSDTLLISETPKAGGRDGR
ncbi:MAG TPA: ADYC domain-containing protein [Gemmatimonadales bacterium]|nr:ADYC domain-containing protein [Gemmatimonadales bacterium]